MTREEREVVETVRTNILCNTIADGRILVSLIDRLSAKCKELEEEDKQWDKHSLVEIVKERDALKEENQRLREALEVIAKPSIGWDGSSNEMRQIARQALKDARAALAQAAKKGGE